MHHFATWPTLALLLALPSADSQEISFGVPRGARIEKTFEGRSEISLDEQTITINGEEIENLMDDFDLRSTWTRELVFLDEYLAVGPERPMELVREFVSLQSGELMRIEIGAEDHEQRRERESPLEERSVRFTWDEDDEDYARRYDGEGRADAELLEDLAADCDLLAFLPQQSVEEGDSWKLDPKHFHSLTNPGGNVQLLADEDDEEDTQRFEQFRDNLEGELVATFEGLRDEDGVQVAVIALRADITTHATQSHEDEDGDPVEVRFQRDFDCEGEILWDLAGGRPLSFRVAGDVRAVRIQTTSWVDEDDGENMVLVERVRMTGDAVFTGAWRAVD